MRASDCIRAAGRYAAGDLRQDLAAGLALAAVALPAQMATAHLAGFPPATGLIAFAAGAIGFAAFGANRFVVACADSTIAPIFAGGLATLAASGNHDYFALCASFALMAGGILFCCGLFRLGWIADLVSRPVTIGFLAGIACHIVISQLPFLLGIAPPGGSLLQSVFTIAGKLGESNPVSLLLGLAMLILATVTAIIVLPVGAGVATGIMLSLLHGIWSTTRARLITFEKVPETSIWWPPGRDLRGETIEGVLVIAFQAPLSFLNAYVFQDGARRVVKQSRTPLDLIVLEASSIVEIDFTAAQILIEFIEFCAQSKIRFAVARLESVRAGEAFERLGITDAVNRDHFFLSVDEAIRVLAKKTNEFPEDK